MDIISSNYLPGDQRLIEQIVRELKSQGIFDQFRKECISDVDTKPAYQNLRQRVESSVSGFLTKQTWNPEMNKNQVREMLRKNIYESGFLETGVERIVDQVVNPKITTVFLTKVEDVVYKFLGIEKPVKVETNIASPMKINSFHDLLPKDLEAISPEMPEERYMDVKDEIEDVKMEEESPSYEMLNEKKEKLVPEENSVDSSQSSILSGIISNDSNPSQKQDSLMSLNSSESRMSLVISENTPKIEAEDIFLSQKSSDSNSKVDLQMVEKMDIEAMNQDAKNEFGDTLNSVEQNKSQNEVSVEETLEGINSKLKDNVDKKRERHHSSSERSKSKSDKDKDRSRSDKHKKIEREPSKEQKIEKEKYRIPKLSEKNKIEKVGKSKEKDNKNKEKPDKDVRTDRDKKSDKDKKSSKHSSERDRSKTDSKSKRDNKSDKKDKDKDDKREKKDSSRNDKSKDDRKSSSSKKKESSSSKERYRERDKDNKKSNEESPEKNKNGHTSSNNSSSTKKDNSSSKYKKDEDKSRSSRKKDDKNDKDDKKRKKSSKDDHYSSKEKKNGRRSSDRDSDGPPNSKILPTTPQKNSEKYSQKPKQDSSHSSLQNSTDNTGNKDEVEEKNEESGDSLQLEMQKIKLPKFASNLQEAMKIMKIRKQLKKLENTNKLSLENLEVKKLLKDIAELSKDGKKDKIGESIEDEKITVTTKGEENKESTKTLLDINDFISSSNISMAKWNALEAKFMEEMGCVDYDSYESPYLDDEESISVEANTNFERIEKILEKVKNKEQEQIDVNIQGISAENKSVGDIKQAYLTEDERVSMNAVEINSLKIDENILSSSTETEVMDVADTIQENITAKVVVPEEMIEETVLNMQDAVVHTDGPIDNIEVTKSEYIDEIVNNMEEADETAESIARNVQDTVDCVEEIVNNFEENVEILDETVFNIAETVNNVAKYIKESVGTTIVEHTEETIYNIEKMNQNTEKSIENSKETIKNIEKTREVFKNNIEQIGEMVENNTEDNEELNHLTHYMFDPEEYNQLNLLKVMSKQPDFVMKSAELEEVQHLNEMQSNILKSSKIPSSGVDSKAILLQKLNKFEDCRRKAIVILEKHSLTEELIKFKRNGKHVSPESFSVNLKGDKPLNTSKTEKENNEVNKIIIVGKSTSTETHTTLENEAKPIGNMDENLIYQDTVQTNKNSADYLEEKIIENNEVIFSTTSDKNLMDNHGVDKVTHTNCAGRKILDTFCQKSDGAAKTSTFLGVNIENLGDDEEDPCLGFEAPDDGRNLTILKCLIKSIEDNVSESIEKMKQLKCAKEQKITLHTRKRKVKGDRSDISNNNLENIGSKRRRTQTSPKSVQEKEEENTGISDIALENKFSLPLSPAESESSSEKRVDLPMVGTKSRRSIQLISNNSKKVEECGASSTVKNFKPPSKNSREKKSARQRYSSEDLYKPRIFLRRTRNGPNKL